MCTALSEALVFKLFRAETATGTVTSPPIVIALDIIDYRLPHYFPTDKAFVVNVFDFQRVKETFRTIIIVGLTLPR